MKLFDSFLMRLPSLEWLKLSPESILVGILCGLSSIGTSFLLDEIDQEPVKSEVVRQGDAASAGSTQEQGELLEGNQRQDVRPVKGVNAATGSHLPAKPLNLGGGQHGNARPLHDAQAECGCVRAAMSLGKVAICHCANQNGPIAQPMKHLIEECPCGRAHNPEQ